MSCEDAENAADELKRQGRYVHRQLCLFTVNPLCLLTVVPRPADSYNEAIETWRNIIEACGESADRYTSLGVCMWMNGDTNGAPPKHEAKQPHSVTAWPGRPQL